MLAKVPVSLDAHTEDSILGGRILLQQPRVGFRAAIDSVFLPAAVPARAGDLILDLGTGVGAAALCLLRRVAGCKAIGLELQPDLAELARRNADRNALSDSFEVVTGDVSDPSKRITSKIFSHVIMNPPYLDTGRGRAPKSVSRAKSMLEGEATLARWIDFGLDMLKPKGSLTIIHRADRLQDILYLLKESAHRTGEVVVFPLWPETRGKPAIRVIVRARKGIATPLRLAAGIVLHEADGSFTREAESILRDGRALAL